MVTVQNKIWVSYSTSKPERVNYTEQYTVSPNMYV